MALNARSKGQTGEREVADLLNAAVHSVTGTWGDFKRNLQQTQDGGFDLCSERYPYFAIEVKRVEALTPAVINGFWSQALRQAKLKDGRELIPVLIYRKSRTPWRVRTYGHIIYSTDKVVIDILGDDFIVWFKKQITAIHGKETKA